MYKIYKITNRINQKVYVGKTKQDIQKRFNDHKQCARRKVNRHLYDSMNHYGPDNFIVECIEDNILKDKADERERFWIDKLGCISPSGYNMTKGGGGGFTTEHWSHERRKRLHQQQASNRLGQKRTPEQRSRMSAAAKRRQESYDSEKRKEISNKISKTNKLRGIRPPEEFISKPGCIGFFKGRNHTDSTKRKLSKARKGKTYEEVYKDKDRAIEVRREKSENFKGANNPNYVEFSDTLKSDIISFLSNNRVKMTDLETKFGISLYKIRKWMRQDLLIDNYQRISNEKNEREWKEFWNAYKN